MKFVVDVRDTDDFTYFNDWKKLEKVSKELKKYLRLRGHNGKIDMQLERGGRDLYVTMERTEEYSNLNKICFEFNNLFPDFIFDPEED